MARRSALSAFVIKELRHILRDRQTLLILLLLPLAQVVLFGFAVRTDVNDIRVAFVEPAPDHATAALRTRFAGNGQFEIAGTAASAAALEPRFRRTGSDDEERLGAATERVDGELDALVGNESGDDEKIGLGRSAALGSRRVEIGIDRGRDDGIDLPTVVLADTGGDVAGVRDEVIDAPRGGAIPATKKTGRRSVENPRFPSAPEVVLEAIPDVAHGRVAITDVKRSFGRDGTLGGTVGARENQVESREIQGLDRPGKEREVPAVVPLDQGQLLDEGGSDGMGFDAGAGRARHVEESEYRRGRVELEKELQHLFTAAEPGEPVVNDGDPHPIRQAGRGGPSRPRTLM